jgi:hypothetical protein
MRMSKKLLAALFAVAACTSVDQKTELDPFDIHVDPEGKADGEAGIVSAADLARVDGALLDAITRGEATIARLEEDIARLEADNQRKLDEIAALVRQIDQRKDELRQQANNNSLLCLFFPNPAICFVSVMISNDSRIQQLERDRARAQEALRQGQLQLAQYVDRRNVLREKIVPLREGRARLVDLLRHGVSAGELPSVLTAGSPEARAYTRADVLSRIAEATRGEIALLVEIRNAAAELSGQLDTALATVRALATDVDNLVADARGDFMDAIEALLSGDADALARDWLDDALAARTRDMLSGLDWPARELVDHLIATRGEGEVDLDALARSLLDKLGGATDVIVGSTVQVRVLDNTDAVSTIDVPTTVAARAATVAVRIQHTWIGDLRVSLEHGGRTFVLHDRTGGSADDLMTTFDVALPDGFDTRGAWKLHVADQAAQDEGRLLGWDLTLRP